MKSNDEPKQTYAVFSVTEDQWGEFIDMMDDSDSSFETWAEWNASFDQFRVESKAREFKVVMVPVDLNEFREWCERHRLPMGILARCRYAEERFQEENNS